MRMDNPLTKTGLAWVVTRLIGCWFAWLGFKAFNMMIYAVYLLNTSGWSSIRSNAADRAAWDIAWPGIIGFFFYAGVAFYFLRKGNRFVELICCESPRLLSKDGSSVVEQDPFKAWLAEDDSRRYLPPEDQRREFAASQPN